jgi:hypothetical protein
MANLIRSPAVAAAAAAVKQQGQAVAAVAAAAAVEAATTDGIVVQMGMAELPRGRGPPERVREAAAVAEVEAEVEAGVVGGEQVACDCSVHIHVLWCVDNVGNLFG